MKNCNDEPVNQSKLLDEISFYLTIGEVSQSLIQNY